MPFLEREAPLGYVLVIPAVLYLTIFIAYPFLMAIWLSLTDAEAGNAKWSFIGLDNYSKVVSSEVRVNDLVLVTLPTREEAEAFQKARSSAKLETTPQGARFRTAVVVAGRTIPLFEMDSSSDSEFAADTVVSEFDWRIHQAGKGWEVVAHGGDEPIRFGPFPDRAAEKKALESSVLVKADTKVQTNGTGVAQDPNFRLSLLNTFKYTFGTELVKLFIGVPCALILNRKFGARRLLRGLVVIPWVIPIAISAQAWLWILDSTYSVINWCLVRWGILNPGNIINFRGDPQWAMFSVVLVNVWRGFPFTAIVILAGLTAIPDEILERARLDGANAFQRFIHIIGPMVRPILMVSLLFSVIFSFTDFNTIWIITKGGPFDQTQVLSTYAYQLGVNAGYLGKGAATSLFMFPLMAVMVFFMLRFLRREN